MIDQRPSSAVAPDILVTVFRRLFENEFATLDGIAISHRVSGGMSYIDESVAVELMLSEGVVEALPIIPADPEIHTVHGAIYRTSPEYESVVSGWSRHLQALQAEEMPLPAPTSMMRKRGISELEAHIVAPGALSSERLEATLERARETTSRNDMAHLLLVTTAGMVVVGGLTPIEAMAHWHNVEFAARVECMRIEEAVVHRSAG